MTEILIVKIFVRLNISISRLLQVLCKGHPVEFASYFHYCHTLTFDQRPDYGFLKRLFRDLFSREGLYMGENENDRIHLHWLPYLHQLTGSLRFAGYEMDYIFDWTIIKYQQAQKTRNQSQV